MKTTETVQEMGWSITYTGGGFASYEQQFGDLVCWINDGEGSLPESINEPCTLHVLEADSDDSEPMVSIQFENFVAANAVAQCIVI